MSYGNFNTGLMICLLKSAQTGKFVGKAKATITGIQIDAREGGKLALFDTNANSAHVVSAEADELGIAFVEFLWDPRHIGYFIHETSQPTTVVGRNSDKGEAFEAGTKTKLNFEATNISTHSHLCVNLGNILKTGTGVFKGYCANGIRVLKIINDLLSFRAKVKGERLPKLQILKFMRPSTELYSLLGIAEIKMKQIEVVK